MTVGLKRNTQSLKRISTIRAVCINKRMSKRAPEMNASDASAVPFKKKRMDCCEYCEKKNHVLVDCKCKLRLCIFDLSPERHQCVFNYREAEQARLSEMNPVVKAKKVESF